MLAANPAVGPVSNRKAQHRVQASRATHQVVAAPVQQVQVVVVHQVGRVEDALGRLRDVPEGLLRGPRRRVLRVQRCQAVPEALRWGWRLQRTGLRVSGAQRFLSQLMGHLSAVSPATEHA